MSTSWGAFVVSLDFELHWGLRDHVRLDAPYRENLLGVRKAIPRMLDLFRQYEIGVTWATVGFLFARDRDELQAMFPSLRPTYADAALSPYREPVGKNEDEDPFHYGASLIDLIRATPRQEIGSHTLSHYYCLEDGQTQAQFAEDMRAARAIGLARGLDIKSIVLPRNQMNPAYATVLRDTGFTSFRGNQKSWVYAPAPQDKQPLFRRAARYADNYVDLTGPRTFDPSEIRSAAGLANVRASHFLRPTGPGGARADAMQVARIHAGLEDAAKNRRIFHLWWHPHNFGRNLDANASNLERVLAKVAQLRQSDGLRAHSMGGLVDALAGETHEQRDEKRHRDPGEAGPLRVVHLQPAGA